MITFFKGNFLLQYTALVISTSRFPKGKGRGEISLSVSGITV